MESAPLVTENYRECLYHPGNFLQREYSLVSISGYNFPFSVAVSNYLQSIDELLEFIETWGFAIFLQLARLKIGPNICM